MRAMVGIVALMAVLAAGLFVYRSSISGSGDVTQGTGNVRAAADLTGVKTDLLAIAQAERAHMALNGRYASLQDLHASGELLLDPTRGRPGYTYTVELGDQTFTVTAHYSGQAKMPTVSVDERMQVSER
jgi:hypothetical protein